MKDVLLRPCAKTDVPEICSIYREQVLQGTATWEYDPPDEVEMDRRVSAILAQGYPYWVARAGGVVIGYSYASSYRARMGYRFVVEDSIYIRADMRGRGYGRALLLQLIDSCKALGYMHMIAVIGDSANLASVRLHERCGFRTVGVFAGIGYKFDRWLDSVQMLRQLSSKVL